jgi:hypothetical protein
LEACATGTDGKEADEIGATTGIAGTTGLIELPAVGGSTEVAATAATTAVVVVLLVVLVVVLIVALLAVALLGALLQPIDGALGGRLPAQRGQRAAQRQGGEVCQEPAAGAASCDRVGQGIEGGRVHGSSCAEVGRHDRRTGQRFSCAVLRHPECSSVAAARHRVGGCSCAGPS